MWTFTMAHVGLDDVLPPLQTQMVASRLPYQERIDALQVNTLHPKPGQADWNSCLTQSCTHPFLWPIDQGDTSLP